MAALSDPGVTLRPEVVASAKVPPAVPAFVPSGPAPAAEGLVWLASRRWSRATCCWSSTSRSRNLCTSDADSFEAEDAAAVDASGEGSALGGPATSGSTRLSQYPSHKSSKPSPANRSAVVRRELFFIRVGESPATGSFPPRMRQVKCWMGFTAVTRALPESDFRQSPLYIRAWRAESLKEP
jgi:hypothetical protein